MKVTSQMIDAAMTHVRDYMMNTNANRMLMATAINAAISVSAEELTGEKQVLHELETGKPAPRPDVDEDLVAYLGASAELFNTIINHTDNINIKTACGRALEMATRLGNEHRTMFIPYQTMVQNLFKDMKSPAASLIHAGVGVAGEAGELLDALKKHWVYGKELDVVNVLEELGDLCFYQQVLLNKFGWTWADVRMANRMKLAKCYPDGVYTDAHAQARLDKEAEHAAIEPKDGIQP